MSIAALLQAAEYIERRERGEYYSAACIFTHMCVFSFLLRSTGSFIVVAPVCLCVPCHWHMATNACTVVGSRNVTFVITPILASLLLRVYSVFSQYRDYRLKLNITSSVLKY